MTDTEQDIALSALSKLVELYGNSLTPSVALLLAEHLTHLAGGDGRGTFTIVHDPLGDRIL